MLFINNFENLTTRRGLYCIWGPAGEGETTRLVARWIDPQAEAPKAHEEECSCAKEEASETCLGMNLRSA